MVGPRPEHTAAALHRAADRLRDLANRLDGSDTPTDVETWLALRAITGRGYAAVDETLGEIDRSFGVPGARTRILAHLRANLGRTIDKDDLRGVAGIHEWARRVRELREDEGWVIHTNTTNPTMSPGQYRLDRDEADAGLVDIWVEAKNAAKLKSGPRKVEPAGRLVEFLESIHPRAAAVDQIATVIGKTNDLDLCLVELDRRGVRTERVALTDPLTPGGVRLVKPAESNG